jgi:DNA (cytosine-5)-methyltransferase 1
MTKANNRTIATIPRGYDKVVDLFSGAGGFSLGAARAGFAVCCAVELDYHAAAAHRRNFPGTLHIEGDVSRLTGRGLNTALGLRNGELSGIVGGPPCQGFSCIGKNDISDPRNELFVDFFRIVAEARPSFFLAENVPGILDDFNAQIRTRAFSYVENEYVLLAPMTICAKNFGAPTTRKRIFFFGYRQDDMQRLSPEDFIPPAEIASVTVRDALRGLPARIDPRWQTEEAGWRVVRAYGKGFFAHRLHGCIPPGVGDPQSLERLRRESRASGCLGTIHSERVAGRYSGIESGKRDLVSKSYRLDLNGFCPTLRAGTGNDRGRFQAVRPLHPTQNRVITPREAARLQGFPDWFQFSPTKWHSFRQIGSSVSPVLAERILTIIRKSLSCGR